MKYATACTTGPLLLHFFGGLRRDDRYRTDGPV